MELMKRKIEDVEGAIAIPVIAWFLGAPALLCVIAWLLFFR